jgi:hypothetical protein
LCGARVYTETALAGGVQRGRRLVQTATKLGGGLWQLEGGEAGLDLTGWSGRRGGCVVELGYGLVLFLGLHVRSI